MFTGGYRKALTTTRGILPSVIMVICLLCQPAGVALADPPELPGVDLRDLDADETKILMDVLESQFDPCGKQRSFLESLKDAETCAIAPKLANFAVGQIQRGLSKRQVVRALLKELRRLTVRHQFTLDGRPSVGPSNARVTVVEFYDFQCPHCRHAAETIHKLVRARDGVRLVHKQYPLSFHPAARTAAIAALAANAQGKFFEVHDQLFEDQERLDDTLIAKIVEEAGVDMGRYAEGLKAAEALVEADRREGDQAGVEGTPTFYVNGLLVEFEDLEAAIDAALKTGTN